MKKKTVMLAISLLLLTACNSTDNENSEDISACFDAYSSALTTVTDSDSLVLSDVIDMSTISDDSKANAGKIDSTLQIVILKDNKNGIEKAELTNFSRFGETTKSGTYKNGRATIDNGTPKECTAEEFEKEFYVNIPELTEKDIVSVDVTERDFGEKDYTAVLNTKSKTVQNIFIPDNDENGSPQMEKAELVISTNADNNVVYWTYDTEYKFKKENGTSVKLTLKNSMSVSGENATVVE